MRLADIAEVNPSTDVARLESSASVSFIPMSDLSDDGRWLGAEKRSLSAVRIGYTSFQEGDVLFAKITPCMENGKGCLATGLVNGIGFGSTEFHVLRPKPGADAQYLFQWTKFKPFRQKAANAMTGSAGQQRVPADFVRRFVITQHSPKEQAKIGEVLAKVDLAIEQTEAALTKQQRIKAGLTQDLLTRGLDAQGRVRDPATHRFKSSALGFIPEEWDTAPFISICRRIGVGIATSCSPHFRESGVPLIRNQNISAEGIILEDLIRISTEFAGANSTKALEPGDIVTVRTGYPGLSCVISEAQRGWQTFTTLISRPNPRVACSKFYADFINSEVGKRAIANLQAGGAQQNLNSRVLETLIVPVPNRDEQTKIATILEQASKLESRWELVLAKLRHLKNGLMQDLLSGWICVTPLLAERPAVFARV